MGWSGLVSDYYGARWASWTGAILNAVATNTTVDWNQWNRDELVWEQAWSANTTMYPTTASGVPPLTIANAMISKYFADDLSGYTVYANTDVDVSPAPPQWTAIAGSTGKAAVGPDCPWVSKGDGSSVASCEASCASVARCNAFNLNLGGSDCELRECEDPSNPQLSDGFPGWAVWGHAAAPGTALFNAWHQDAPALAYLCGLTPTCLGFNSKGDLIRNVSNTNPSVNTTLYVRNAHVTASVDTGRVAPARPAPTKKPLPTAPPSMTQRLMRRKA